MNIIDINDTPSLKKLVRDLQNLDEIALDLEFDRNRYRYGFNMCLMQVFDGSETFLIDPLNPDLEISYIFPLMEDEGIQKVVFAFGEDLRLFHSLGCFPKNILDLDIAGSLLNYPPSSLTSLLEEVLNIEPESSSQQSNWYKRPLSDRQKQYAASDVYHLLKLKKALMEEAKEKSLDEWILEENKVMDSLDYSDEDHNNLLKHKDKKGFSEFDWYVFKKIMDFFDSKARKYNRPMYHLAGKKILKDLAEDPSRVNAWEETKGIFGKIKSRTFKKELQELLDQATGEAMAKGLSKSEPALKPMDDEEYRKYQKQKRMAGRIKSEVFSPLQDRLTSKLGKHAKAYILPNRLVQELIDGEAEPLPPYKKTLFRDYASQLEVDIDPFLD